MLSKDSKIYVAGHRGLVGSAIWNNLQQRGYTNLVGRTHAELDLTDQVAVRHFFDEEHPDAVVLAAAFVGAMAVMALIFFFSTMVRSHVMLLIIGIMIGYIANSAISLLNFFATDEGVKSYMVWGMGSFGGVSMKYMGAFAGITAFGLVGSLLLMKPLNALLLGDRYAENLGVNIQRVRNWLLFVTGLLTAITTAFCGPVAFIGLAVPHIARLLLTTDNHRYLMPATMLCGAVVALLCNVICVLPGESGVIPLNAVTPIIGAPVIIYVIIRERR